MADFEDANSPTWANCVEGQREPPRRGRAHDRARDRREDVPAERRDRDARVRPRGWHLPERHLEVDGEPVSASLFDFGLDVFHIAREQLERGTGPYFYLPKLESHLEARLWATRSRSPRTSSACRAGSIRATVLIETMLAAFEMDEILYELRDHSCGAQRGPLGLHLQRDQEAPARGQVLPDRTQVTMTVPFMRAYTELLVQTCHRRGAHAIGGMAAFIPSRARPRGERARAREGARGQGARGGRRLRRHVGRAPRPRPGRERGVRRGARRTAEPARAAARRRRTCGAEQLLDLDVARRRGHRGGPAPERLGRRPLPRRVAARHRRGGDRQPDGGRATAEISRSQVWQWVRQAGFYAPRVRREVVRARRRPPEARRSSSPRWRSATSSSSSSRSRPTTRLQE